MKQQETLKVVEPLRLYMEHRGWLVIKIHGNMFQMGLPDLYCVHPQYDPKWIECKVKGGSLTQAQRILFPKLILFNVKLYIVEAEDLRGNIPALALAYDFIFGPPNAGAFMLGQHRRF